MDTQNLRAFVAVAENSSFSTAAAKLHITQPAISKRIHLLEEQLDTSLFDRIGRQVSLTEAGRTLLPLAQKILANIESAKQAVADLSGEVRGQLKLVTSHHIGLHRLPLVLREYSERYPLVDLDIRFMDSAEAFQAVQHGEFDLGIVTEVDNTEGSVCSKTIWVDQMQFVTAQQHPLAQQKNVTLDQLSQYPALLPERRFFTTQLVETLFAQQGLQLQINLSTNFLETIKALITAGYAWGVLPESMLNDDSLAVLKVSKTSSASTLGLSRKLDCIYHKQRQMGNAATAFFELLCQQNDQSQ